MKNSKNVSPLEMAHFRFSIIAPIIQDLYQDKSVAAYCRRISETPLRLPDGSKKTFAPSTIESWVTLFKKGGIDGLMPAPRADKGTSRTIDSEAASRIISLKEQFPRINGVLIHSKLIEENLIPATVSVRAVQRFLRENDLKSTTASNPNMKHRLAFEFPKFGEMWQADTAYLPYITENGVSRRTYLIVIIDDHSRMIVGAEIFYNDNAANFQKVLKDAVKTYGIPDKLYLDNGSPYSNAQLTLILDSLGIVESHTAVRDGASKGKVERNFRTIRSRWLSGLDANSIHSLEHFNTLLSSYVTMHNTSVHGATKESPTDRYLRTKDHVRIPKSSEWLDECFLNRINRRVRKDSTLTIDGTSFDVPPQFVGMQVEVRYIPGRSDSAFILYGNIHFPLKITNKNSNAYVPRSNHHDSVKDDVPLAVPHEEGGIML